MHSFCYTLIHSFAYSAISPVPSLLQRINQLLCHSQQKESPDDSGIGEKGIDKTFETGRTPKASGLKEFAEAQGWKTSQTGGGPLKYVDENGIPRVTIKQCSSRAPGSSNPYVEFKDATGQRTGAFGNPVTRKSPCNYTSIDFEL